MAPERNSDDAVTLWSQTLFDLLVVAIQRRNERDVLHQLHEIRARGFRKRAVIAFLRDRVSDKDIAYCERVVVLMGGAGGPAVRKVKPARGTVPGPSEAAAGGSDHVEKVS